MEKNRATQRRYRERKKEKLEEYKHQVDAMSKELELLRTENSCLESRNRVLTKALELKAGSEVADVPAAQPAQGEVVKKEDAEAWLWQNERLQKAAANFASAVGVDINKLPQKSVRRSEEVKELHTTYVMELSRLLSSLYLDKNPAAEQELEAYVMNHRVAALGLLKALEVKSFAQLHAFKRLSPPISRDVLVRTVEGIAFTPSQKRGYIDARRALLQRSKRLQGKRKSIISNLEAAMARLEPDMSQQAVTLQACEASDALRDSLDENYRSITAFYFDCIQINTALQEAKMFVETFPAVPDPFTIATYLAAQEQGQAVPSSSGALSQQALRETGDITVETSGDGRALPPLAVANVPDLDILPGLDELLDLDAVGVDMWLEGFSVPGLDPG